MESFESALDAVHRVSQSRRIADALSLVMSRRAIRLYNRDKMNSRTLEIVMKNALKLNPANEQALVALDDVQGDIEIIELEKAFSRHKMHKAYKIASESRHQTVKDHFFTFMEELIDGLEDDMDFTRIERHYLLHELRGWCAKLDESHPLVYRIDGLIRRT